MDYTSLKSDLVAMMFIVTENLAEEVSIHQEELRLQLKDSKDELAQDFERRGDQASSDLRREVQTATNQVKQEIDRHGQAISSEFRRQTQVEVDDVKKDLEEKSENIYAELRQKTDNAKSSIDDHVKSCKDIIQQQMETSTG